MFQAVFSRCIKICIKMQVGYFPYARESGGEGILEEPLNYMHPLWCDALKRFFTQRGACPIGLALAELARRLHVNRFGWGSAVKRVKEPYVTLLPAYVGHVVHKAGKTPVPTAALDYCAL